MMGCHDPTVSTGPSTTMAQCIVTYQGTMPSLGVFITIRRPRFTLIDSTRSSRHPFFRSVDSPTLIDTYPPVRFSWGIPVSMWNWCVCGVTCTHPPSGTYISHTFVLVDLRTSLPSVVIWLGDTFPWLFDRNFDRVLSNFGGHNIEGICVLCTVCWWPHTVHGHMLRRVVSHLIKNCSLLS